MSGLRPTYFFRKKDSSKLKINSLKYEIWDFSAVRQIISTFQNLRYRYYYEGGHHAIEISIIHLDYDLFMFGSGLSQCLG